MDESEIKEVITLTEKKDRWKNRRRMAWASFVLIFAISCACFVFPAQINTTSGVLSTIILILGSIILGYLGLATIDDKWHRADK